MPNSAVDELLEAYSEATTLTEAEDALRSIETSGRAGEVALGDLYDELAQIAAEEDDFALAVRSERRALELGCDLPMLGREMLGWYLMKDGQRLAGEAEFDALLKELGPEPELLIALGNARSDSGHEVDALKAFDEALVSAKKWSDPDAINRARVERRACREGLGLPLDDDDRRVRRGRFASRPSQPVAVAVGWFPRGEHAAALDRWPELNDDLADADAYCRRIEEHLQEIVAATAQRPSIAPLTVSGLVEYADREELDAGDASTRAGIASALHQLGETIAWPPGRNEPCWCRSGRKYKRCCGA